MKSGLLLSSVITIWIVATIVAVNMFLPDIKTTVQTARSINSDSSFTVKGLTPDDIENANSVITSYTPLGILDKLGLK